MPSSRFLASLPVLPVALLTSLLFSLLLTLNHQPLNDDAFSYLRAAERFQQEGLNSVVQDYGWPGYAILIALADLLLPGGLDVSAHVLNALSYLLLTWTFIALQRDSGANQRQTWLAAGVVLLFPLLNEMRSFIIRDAAYWAFSLLALLQLLRFARAVTPAQGLPLALAWCGSTLLASVFRLEALLPALLAPLALLACHPADNRNAARASGLQPMLMLYGLLLVCALLALLLAFAAGVNLPGLMGFAWRYYLPLLLDLGAVLRDDALALNSALFTADNFPGSTNVALGLLILVFGYAMSVLLNLAAALGIPYAALLVLGWQQRLTALPRAVVAPWLGYAVPAALALLVFQFIMHFQTQRYAALLALLLLVWAPGILEQWWQRAERHGRAARVRITLGVFCLYLAADSLVSFGYSKQYLKEAEQWLQQELPADATLTTNSFQLAWGSGRVVDHDKTQRDVALTLEDAAASTWLAIDLKQGDLQARALLDQTPHLQLVSSFRNERGDEVRIYRRTEGTR
jgi:hypothetical protein